MQCKLESGSQCVMVPVYIALSNIFATLLPTQLCCVFHLSFRSSSYVWLCHQPTWLLCIQYLPLRLRNSGTSTLLPGVLYLLALCCHILCDKCLCMCGWHCISFPSSLHIIHSFIRFLRTLLKVVFVLLPRSSRLCSRFFLLLLFVGIFQISVRVSWFLLFFCVFCVVEFQCKIHP